MTININIENKELKKQNETLEQDKEAIYSIWKKAINRENNLIIENKQLKQENEQLKECNLRYRNHNNLLESIIGIKNYVIE